MKIKEKSYLLEILTNFKHASLISYDVERSFQRTCVIYLPMDVKLH